MMEESSSQLHLTGKKNKGGKKKNDPTSLKTVNVVDP